MRDWIVLKYSSVYRQLLVNRLCQSFIANSGLSKGIDHHFPYLKSLLLQILRNIICTNGRQSSTQTDTSNQPFCILILFEYNIDSFQQSISNQIIVSVFEPLMHLALFPCTTMLLIYFKTEVQIQFGVGH